MQFFICFAIHLGQFAKAHLPSETKQYNRQVEKLYIEMASAVNSIKKLFNYIEAPEESKIGRIQDDLQEVLKYKDSVESVCESLEHFLPQHEFYDSTQIKKFSSQLDNDFNKLIDDLGTLHEKINIDEFEKKFDSIEELNVIVKYIQEKQKSNSHIAENDDIKKSLIKLENILKETDNKNKPLISYDLSDNSKCITEILYNRISAYNERIIDRIVTLSLFEKQLDFLIKKYNSDDENASSKEYYSFKDFIDSNISKIMAIRGIITERNEKENDNLVNVLLNIHNKSFKTAILERTQERSHEHQNHNFLKPQNV
ncbi:hypothetical protein EDEG_01558 [Edhazardia aedis USNM 41457]|uniref:Uncharacterized protein n=1 Tax=Edhazardia aedis (strain USNM 41457) TaxID=1003232 RepID=J9D9I2_EDHAE|nr:hypothetical protein EDEG_01558 [Edhazardia aedis USNM 41457]|eukprot:EJW04154.1 hypothetical protein EDEG_01558 [Edhazardia aedis USNM 41457]